MQTLELLVIAIGLSMDAFAVAICKGLSLRTARWSHACIVGCYFGGFQALMPVLGYVLGRQFSEYIQAYDHWVAFGLLGFVGIRMIVESRQACPVVTDSLDMRSMLVLSVATSIDALAVGITFSFLQVQILPAAASIGIVTFTLSFIGMRIGSAFGTRFKAGAELAGGIILIAMGAKILFEHIGVL